MRAVILGAGSAGSHLAARLCAEKYDVVVVDRKAEPLAELSSDLDILTIEGHGSSPMILERAGIREAEIFVARGGGATTADPASPDRAPDDASSLLPAPPESLTASQPEGLFVTRHAGGDQP